MIGKSNETENEKSVISSDMKIKGKISADGDLVLLGSVVGDIKCHSLSVEDPKNPKECNVFKLYEVIASKSEVELLSKQYLKGGIGYGEAKELLLDKILNRFSENREKYFQLLEDRSKVEELLFSGCKKARVQAQKVLKRVRSRVGF